MASITDGTDLLRAVHDQARKDALDTAIRTVDNLLNHSDTLEDFSRMWATTKVLYEAMTAVEDAS